jgi:hypothetical protein
MSELIYHTDESADGGASPFSTAIREIGAGEDVLFASPYITLDYLEDVLNDTASWRLLTDMEAWLDNYRTSEKPSTSSSRTITNEYTMSAISTRRRSSAKPARSSVPRISQKQD